jgi:imidazolonepropionase-like amidohydrolase
MTGRSKVELRNRTLRNPAILARAGVLLALTTDHNAVPINFLALQATLAVKEGLDPDTALRSITANPARILGLDDRVGALKTGLDGDVVLWSGDPLDVRSRALHAFVAGQPVYHYEEGNTSALGLRSPPLRAQLLAQRLEEGTLAPILS